MKEEHFVKVLVTKFNRLAYCFDVVTLNVKLNFEMATLFCLFFLA